MRSPARLVALLLPTLAACGGAAPGSGPSSPSAHAASSPPAGPLASPGPAAARCTDDSACGTHRCNVAAGKCAFPCATDVDCAPGNTCIHGAVSACAAPRAAGSLAQ